MTRSQIVVLDGHTLNPGDLSWAGLEEMGTVTVYPRTPLPEIVPRAAGAQIVLSNKVPMDGDTIRALPALRYIGVTATGFELIDLQAADQGGIVVTNCPAYSTDSVIQMGIAHILSFCQKINLHSQDVKRGGWSASRDFCYTLAPLVELAGKTIGFVGFGTIGRGIARVARAFGMSVIATSRTRSQTPDWPDFAWATLDEVLARSDVVVLACPLNDETRGLVNKDRLRLMKPSAYLLNMARGPVVVEADLAQALEEGTIAGAGIDVMETEPPGAGNPLYDAPNITITPHIGWATRESRARGMELAVGNVRAFLAGAPANVVNEPRVR